MTFDIGDRSLIFKKISMFLKENYMSSLIVSNRYTLELAKCMYKYLDLFYAKVEILSVDTDSVSEIFFNGLITSKMPEIIRSPDFEGVMIYPMIDTGDSDNKGIVYDYDSPIHPCDVSDKPIYQLLDEINEYNIHSWKVNSSILQYFDSETVVTENSNEDTIANFQVLARALNYTNYTAGYFDDEFKLLCYNIQKDTKSSNPLILCTGYCDIYVEKYLRSQNPAKIEVY